MSGATNNPYVPIGGEKEHTLTVKERKYEHHNYRER